MNFAFFVGHFVWNLAFLQGILVYFYAERGVTLAEVFVIKNMVSIAVVIMQIPTGFVADFFGRKRALLLGAVIKFIGCLIIAVSSDFFLLVIAYSLIGIGISFYSGTDIAIVYEANSDSSTPFSRHEAIAKLRIISGLATFVSTILGGLIAIYSMKLVGWVNAGFALFSVIILLTYRLPANSNDFQKKSAPKVPLAPRTALSWVADFPLLTNKTALTITLIMVVTMFVPMVSIPTFQSAWQKMNVGFGIAAAATAVAGLMGAVSGYLVKSVASRISLPRFLLIVFLLLEASLLFGALDQLMASFFAIALMEVLRAFVLIIGTIIVNDSIENRFRATANSTISLASSVFVAIFAPVWAFGLQHSGHSFAFLFLSGIYGVIFLILGISAFLFKRRPYKSVV